MFVRQGMPDMMGKGGKGDGMSGDSAVLGFSMCFFPPFLPMSFPMFPQRFRI